MNRGKLAAILIGLTIAGGLGVTLGWAAGSDSNQINSCVSTDGQIRVITIAGDACKKSESPLNWSITGPQGVQGPPGAQGPQGPPGATVTVTNPVLGQVSFKGQIQGQFHGGQDGTQTLMNFTGFTEGVVSPRDPATGLPTGKRQHKPITITKEIDAASPLLYKACVTNENLPEVVVGLDPPGSSTPTTAVKLTNASCSELAHNGQYETVSFTYQKITWTWIPGGITAEDDWQAPVS